MAGHAKLSPSQAKRWMNCPGSIALSSKAPPQAANEYAVEGTVAHSLAEELVTGKSDVLELAGRIGSTVKQDGFDIEIGADMIDGALEYQRVIARDHSELGRRRKPSGIIGKSEVRVCASSVDDDLWGTSDYILYRKGDTLIVYDYKFGAGVIVDPRENEQAMIYAIAAMDGEAGWAFDRVVIKIVQPRGVHTDGTVREWTTSTKRLEAFRDELRLAVAATRRDDAPVIAGDWCRWCPAKAFCPQIHKAIQESAQVDFQSAASMTPTEVSKRIGEIRLLSTDRLAKMLVWEDTAKELFTAVRCAIHEKLTAGEEVAGWKLVDGRSNRKWVDETAVVKELSPIVGEERLYERKLLSPAKMEKIVNKDKIAPLVSKPEAAKIVVRDGDLRSAAGSPVQDDFKVLAVSGRKDPIWPL